MGRICYDMMLSVRVEHYKMFEFYQKVSQTRVASFEARIEIYYKKKRPMHLSAIIKRY